MSTQAVIAKRYKNGKFRSIYVNCDGYPEWVGKMLLKHYNTDDMIEQLIVHGNLYCLYPEIGSKHDFKDHGPNDNWSTFYWRDDYPGTPLSECCHRDWDSFAHMNESNHYEYTYVFDSVHGWGWYKQGYHMKIRELKPEHCESLA